MKKLLTVFVLASLLVLSSLKNENKVFSEYTPNKSGINSFSFTNEILNSDCTETINNSYLAPLSGNSYGSLNISNLSLNMYIKNKEYLIASNQLNPVSKNAKFSHLNFSGIINVKEELILDTKGKEIKNSQDNILFVSPNNSISQKVTRPSKYSFIN